ncbi:MAG: phosphoribosylglycinamide formyltransferase [Treponema sp.]|nr:phosphoribosylglycinamide formyltransferase [Treponema sp.]
MNEDYRRKQKNILVLVSGNGSNLQALIDAELAGRFSVSTGGQSGVSGSITAVISDRSGAYALERAGTAGIPALPEEPNIGLSKAEQRNCLSDRLLYRARKHQADIIVMAGFLSILQGEILREYENRIINLHPSLLPKYGGPGMYGSKVHKAVLAAGEKESGCTVHLVDEGTDTGPIILQRKVPVLPEDTAESLAERIHREEHIAIVDAVVLMLNKL